VFVHGTWRKKMANNWLFRSKAGMTFLAVFVALALGILIGSVVSDGVESSEKRPEVAQITISGEGSPLVLDKEVSLHEGFAQVVDTIGPAVVNIRTEDIIQHPPVQGNPNSEAFRDFFGDDLWNRFFDNPEGGGSVPREQKVTNLGSGLIVDPEGYILTNHHVIARADRIMVKVGTGDTYRAEVVGSDPQSDLAVLKIEAASSLPFAKVGDSTSMKVGDWVLAIGSPFGLDRTVTAGIISAIERQVQTGIFGDYIQTDAAINPGNSGGPLVNMRGEVVGVNSFISTRSGGSNGVGFAIPSTVFINSYNQLVSKGKIERGWLGVSMNVYPMTEELAEFFGVAGDDPKGIRNGDGVVITQMIDEKGDPADTGPAYKAGIRQEDVIVKFGDREIRDIQDLRVSVANTPPGGKVPVVVVRQGEVVNVDVELAERTLERAQQASNEGVSLDEREERNREKEIGIEVRTISPRDLEEMGIEDEEGVLVLRVTPGSLADEAGLLRAQLITHVNGEAVSSGQAFKDMILSMPSGQGVVLRMVQKDPRQRQKAIAFTSFVKP
jgi:serine protease Do